jgi:hypothetical protein
MPLVTPAADILAAMTTVPRPATGGACGTRYGYRLHRRQGEDACDPCLAAESVRNRARYRRRSQTWQIRQWARARGLLVEDQGLLPQRIVEFYHAAQAAAVLTPDDPDLPAEER